MNRAGSIHRAVLATALLLTIGANSARAGDSGQPAAPSPWRLAQLNAPPGDVPGEPTNQSEAAALVLRIDRLENQLRQATGTIEQLQNQQHRLEEQLKRFQEDVEFRLNGGHGPAPASEPTPSAKPLKKSDAFDPAADPNAIGAPRPIGDRKSTRLNSSHRH